MPPGRPPKPTILKKLEGTARPDRINDAEPQPAVAAPRCPAWLEPEARREWRAISAKLLKLGLLTEVDGTALAAYCQSYARWKQAEALISRDGMTFTTGEGMIRLRPEVGVSQKERLIMKGYLTMFGLAPSARTNLRGATPEESDPLEELLSRGRRNA